MLMMMGFLTPSDSTENGRLHQDGHEACRVNSVTRGLEGQEEGGGRREGCKNNDCFSSGSAHILQFVKTIQFAKG